MSLLPSRTSLFDDLFHDMASGFYIRPLHGDPLPSRITLDLRESDGGYLLQAELPGVAKEDIHVSLEGNVVSLRAEVRQHDQQTDGEKVLRSERYFGQVARSFALPADVDASQAKAKYDNGVLTLTLPKKQASNAQRLHIE